MFHVAFSAKLRHVVAANVYAAIVWDTETSNERCNLLQEGEDRIVAVAVSPTSKLLASAHWDSHLDSSSANSCINVWCMYFDESQAEKLPY